MARSMNEGDSQSYPRGRSLLTHATGTHEAIRRLRVTQLICGVMIGAPMVVVLIGLITRISDDTFVGRSAAGVAATLGLVTFGAALAVIHLMMPVQQAGRSLLDTVRAYRTPCLIAVALNAVGLLVTGVAIFRNGLTHGLWLPLLALVVLNLFGAVLAWPKIRVLRQIHYSPSLPYAH